jgi:cytochrome c oxidase cbb3-type subunit IV
MFRRVVLEDWHLWVPYISFGITFAVFVIVVLRALLMRRDKADHMARLPLEDHDNHSTPRH